MAKLVFVCMQLVRLFLTSTRPVSDKGLDFLYKIFVRPTKPLPPIDDKILLLPAVELAENLRARKMKAETVMQAYIKRIKDVQPFINAYTDQRFADALEEAKKVDQYLETTEKSVEVIAEEQPLLGVPCTCKESVGVKGLGITLGLLHYKDRKAPVDAEAVALLRRAGAIPVVVTNISTRSFWWECDNKVFGMTKNPYNNVRTCGGSSGGEGAIIAAGGSLFGLGSDLGGCVRIPAAFCGIYGHKPSKGIISNHRPYEKRSPTGLNTMQYSTIGPMSRYILDLLLLTKVSAGNTADNLKLQQKVNFRNMKIYYIEEFPGHLFRATKDVKAAVRKAVKHFEEEFDNTSSELRIEELSDAWKIWECKLLESGMVPIKSMFSKGKSINPLLEFIKSIFRSSDHNWPSIYFAAIDRRNKDDEYFECLEKFKDLKEKFDNIFKEDAILLLPTHPEPPPHLLLSIPKYPNTSYTSIFNILGYPSTQIPAGLCNGVPIGIQAVSSVFQDHLTLAAAQELDKVFGGWISPCEIQI